MKYGCTCKMSKLHLYSILPVFRAVKVPVTIENFCCILCQCQDVRNMFVPMIVKICQLKHCIMIFENNHLYTLSSHLGPCDIVNNVKPFKIEESCKSFCTNMN